MTDSFVETLTFKIVSRVLPNGGFSSIPNGEYRPDATAWAVLGLLAAGGRRDLIAPARARLAEDQWDDGRVTLSEDNPAPFWPTALAALAWSGSSEYSRLQRRSVDFLLKMTGMHPKQVKNAAHNTELRGWPWIEGTHSWVEPTSLALLALEATGQGDHERAREARRMLLDRQLDGGGWNYGNTLVFGRLLRPMPSSTGMALNALAGRTTEASVGESLSYLERETGRLRAPLSFSWCLLGLGAWGMRPVLRGNSISECFEMREAYASHRTEELSLMLLSIRADSGLLSGFGPKSTATAGTERT